MRAKLILLLLFINLITTNVFGQALKKNIYNDERQFIARIYSGNCNTDTFSAKKQAFRFDNKEMEAIAELVTRAEAHYCQKGPDSVAIAGMQKAIDKLQLQNYPLTEAYLNYRLGRMLYESGRYTLGVEHLLYAREMVPDGNYNILPYAGSFLSFLGRVYCEYRDYDLGLQYLLQSLRYPFNSRNDVYNMYGNLGLAYYWLNDADSSIWASKQALHVAYETNDSSGIGNMLGNLGAAYLLRKDYASAINYLQKDFEINSHLEEWASAAGALLMQARSYFMLHQTELAFHNLQRVDSIFRFCNCTVPLSLKEYYMNLSNYYRIKGDFRSIVKAQDSFYKYAEISRNENSGSTFKNLELSVVGRMHETKMKFLESERKRQLLTRNIIVISAFFILIIIALLLYVQWRKRKVEQHVFQLKMNNAESRLKTYLENIKDKNALLDQLNQELEKMRHYRANGNNAKSDDSEEIEILSKIKNASLITEEGWLEFTELVELVHRHFFIKLHKQYPELTPAEIRILTLVKLNFNIKEMAGMLGISPDSVRKARQRVRKKLNLSEEESLEDIVMNI